MINSNKKKLLNSVFLSKIKIKKFNSYKNYENNHYDVDLFKLNPFVNQLLRTKVILYQKKVNVGDLIQITIDKIPDDYKNLKQFSTIQNNYIIFPLLEKGINKNVFNPINYTVNNKIFISYIINNKLSMKLIPKNWIVKNNNKLVKKVSLLPNFLDYTQKLYENLINSYFLKLTDNIKYEHGLILTSKGPSFYFRGTNPVINIKHCFSNFDIKVEEIFIPYKNHFTLCMLIIKLMNFNSI